MKDPKHMEQEGFDYRSVRRHGGEDQLNSWNWLSILAARRRVPSASRTSNGLPRLQATLQSVERWSETASQHSGLATEFLASKKQL